MYYNCIVVWLRLYFVKSSLNGNSIMNNFYNKDISKLLLSIISCLISNKKYENKINGEDLKKLCFLAEIHNLSPIIYYVLQDRFELLAKENDKTAEELKKKYRYAIFHSSQQEDYVKEILKAFDQEKVTVLFFKGAELKKYYPVAELRTMGDTDCLILEKDRQTAHKIMGDLGYTNCNRNLDVWIYEKNNIHIEMQSHLAHNGVGNGFDYKAYFSDAFEHTKIGYNSLQLEDEYNLCYLFYHIAKHLSSTGAGIRMILDIAVFTNAIQDKIDFKKLSLMLEETHLTGTANAVYALCDKWFGTSFTDKFNLSGEIPDGLEEYIINGGVFGFETHDTGDVYRRRALENLQQTDNKPSRFKAIKNFFFPSIDYMQQYIPSVKKCPWLLPFAWLKRCFIGLFKRNKHSLNTLNSIGKGDNEQSLKEAQMLRKMGL